MCLIDNSMHWQCGHTLLVGLLNHSSQLEPGPFDILGRWTCLQLCPWVLL